MVASHETLDLIQRWEGFRKSQYIDAAGIPTVGYGFTEHALAQIGRDMPERMDKATAKRVLRQLVYGHYAPSIKNHLEGQVLLPTQLGALCSFCYNVGVGAFSDSTLLERILAGDMEGAKEEFGKWIYADGQVLEGLVRRRADERRFFALGELGEVEVAEPIACRRVERVEHDFDFDAYIPDSIEPHAQA